MKKQNLRFAVFVLLLTMLIPIVLLAQGKLADYERADSLRARVQGLVYNQIERPTWIENTSQFWYRKTVKGGNEFVLVDAEKLTKKPAFDHERLAISLSSATGVQYTAKKLPFTSITFSSKMDSIRFEFDNNRWSCDLSKYTCTKIEQIQRQAPGGSQPQGRQAPSTQQQPQLTPSPDGKWEAYVKNYNVYIREIATKKEFPLSYEGIEGDYYTTTFVWSPDSKKLVGIRKKPAPFVRVVNYVESSPVDQVQPKYSTRNYPKPGDVLDVDMPVLFNIDIKKQILISNALFPNSYSQTPPRWWKDSRAFTFEYNQRGHQAYRIIEVDTNTGAARALVNEECATFFCYYSKKYRADVNDGAELIWMSERDGWNHLYLYDGRTGRVKNQITKGEWVVRGVDRVDETNRQILFRASGMYTGKDPYLIHYYRINFDGTGLTPLTEGDGSHSLTFSPNRNYYIDTYSRVDFPPVAELRRSSDGKLLMELERTDITDLQKTGWVMPEVFVAKGRDGKTDIWGIICRPMNLDINRECPVIEYIYAGPHDSFVPKTFSSYLSMQSVAELGFILVQMDGMGTSNRSKAFHDVCWKNIGDAGFPDRILWHKAAAAKYPYMDISRVGIYGHSAGGQNSTGALLFHPEFYKVAVSSCGCHDNRMDKISWNEQWMGWPIGPEYSASSNVDNAYRLQGKLLLIVGEMDTNVDPSSTLQVVNALMKAKKYFDFLVLPGAGHSDGGTYGQKKRNDFFVKYLLGVEPPDWNIISK